MLIQPSTAIKFMSNIPLDESYTDTLWFPDLNSQLAWFNSKVSISLTAQSFQRATKGTCRVQVPISQMYSVNYMMFQNELFSNKWFFAFVTSVEYVNNATTEIRYVIDEMQTWLFDYRTEQCFVERETVADDGIGVHIEPESVALGEYVLNGEYLNVVGTDKSIVVMIVDKKSDLGTMYGGVYGAALLRVWGTTESEIADLDGFIKTQAEDIDVIHGIYMCPAWLTGRRTGGAVLPYGFSGVGQSATLSGVDNSTPLDGYVPRNNKLLTYPYNFLSVDSPSGSTLALRYEFFRNGTPTLNVTGNVTYPVELTCMPTFYKGTPDYGQLGVAVEYRKERLSIKGFPMCSYAVDAYAAWIAQNSVPTAIGMIGQAANGIVGGLAGQARQDFSAYNSGKQPIKDQRDIAYVQGASSNIISGVTGFLAQQYLLSISADITRGSFDTGSNDFANERMTFMQGRMSIKREIAERIDKYFQCYGYAVGTVKQIETHLRQRFTYVKTMGANVHGNMPSDSADTIAQCFDSGIRFWADHERVNVYVDDDGKLINNYPI